MFFKYIGKASNFFLKWFGLFGLPFYLLWTKTAVAAKAANASAGILDIAGGVYSGMLDTAVNTFVPGAGIILSEIFNAVAPPVASVLTHTFMSAGAAPALPLDQLAPSILP